MRRVDPVEGYIYLEERIKRIDPSERYVIVYGEASKRSAQKFGLSPGPSHEVKLSLSKAQLLSEEELQRWREEKLNRWVRDISVQISSAVDPHAISKLIPLLDKNIIKCDVKDIYEGSQVDSGSLKLCLSVEVIGDKNPDVVMGTIKQELTNLGYHPLF